MSYNKNHEELQGQYIIWRCFKGVLLHVHASCFITLLVATLNDVFWGAIICTCVLVVRRSKLLLAWLHLDNLLARFFRTKRRWGWPGRNHWLICDMFESQPRRTSWKEHGAETLGWRRSRFSLIFWRLLFNNALSRGFLLEHIRMWYQRIK